jgi:ABC-2 type transport system permease protein
VWLAIMLVATGTGFAVDVGRVAQASIGMAPLALITASLVFALSRWASPGAGIGIMAIFLAVSYLLELLRSLLKLPGWIVNLSMFHQYGTPIVDGLNWAAFAGMLLIAAVLLGAAVRQFSVADV